MSQIIKNLASGPVPPSVATSYVTNAGTAVPVANVLNVLATTAAAGTIPVETTGVGNTVTVVNQISQAIASTNLPNVGLSAFNSADFTVDANGFVSLIGGAAAISKINVQTGTSPVVPTSGAITMNGATVTAGTHPVRTDGTGTSTMAVEVQLSQAIASTNATNVGLSAFNSAQFNVDSNGFVSLNDLAFAYTNVNHAASPYTVLSTDEYISVDCSAGTVSLLFPNSPAAKTIWVVKDRTGSAATNNISITTVGGSVTIDGQTTYTINSNYASIQLLANATPTYEVF